MAKTTIQQVIRDTFNLKEQIAGYQTIYDRSREKIQEYFDKKDIKDLEVEGDLANPPLIAKRTERLTTSYQVDKLEAKLDKEIFNEIVDKFYYITDINKLISLMKDAGIKPAQFKACLGVTTTVNTAKIKQLYEVGDLTMEDIAGCYTAKLSKSIDIKERKGDKD